MNAVRKAYIDWKRLDGNSRLEDGKTYLVFMPDMAERTGVIGFAEYHDKGSLVDIPLRKDYGVPDSEPTVESRLLTAIFGRTKRYTVPMDGFYEQTADFGVDEKCENGAFEGCEKQVHMLGNRLPDGSDGALPVFWAECPILPEGFTETGTRQDPPASRLGPDPMALRDRLEDDEAAMYAYKGITGQSCPGTPPVMPGDGDTDIMLPGAVAKTDAVRAAGLVLEVLDAARLAAGIPEKTIEKFNQAFAAAKTPEDRRKLWSKFRDEHHIGAEHATPVLKCVQAMSGAVPGFFQNRDRILARGSWGGIDNVQVMAEAWGETRFPWRIYRLAKLLRLAAPQIIVANELRQACEAYAACRFAGLAYSVDKERFGSMFGIYPDGTRSGTCTYLGDAELHRDYLERAAAKDDHDEDEESGDSSPMSDSQAARHELDMTDTDGPRYRTAYLPNFMMRRRGMAVLDTRTDRYLRDEAAGEIRTWDAVPSALLEKLNAEA